jgi:hypothetical protein
MGFDCIKIFKNRNNMNCADNNGDRAVDSNTTAENFQLFALHRVKMKSVSIRVSYSKAAVWCFPGSKRPEREVDYSPPSIVSMEG